MISFNEWRELKETAIGKVPGVSDELDRLMQTLGENPPKKSSSYTQQISPERKMPGMLTNFKNFINRKIAPSRAHSIIQKKYPNLDKRMFDTVLKQMKGRNPEVHPPYSGLNQMTDEDWTDHKRLAKHWLQYKQENDWVPKRAENPKDSRIQAVKEFIGDLASHPKAGERKKLLDADAKIREDIVMMTPEDWDEVEKSFEFLSPKEYQRMGHALRWLHMNMKSFGTKYNRKENNLSQWRDKFRKERTIKDNPPLSSVFPIKNRRIA